MPYQVIVIYIGFLIYKRIESHNVGTSFQIFSNAIIMIGKLTQVHHPSEDFKNLMGPERVPMQRG